MEMAYPSPRAPIHYRHGFEVAVLLQKLQALPCFAVTSMLIRHKLHVYGESFSFMIPMNGIGNLMALKHCETDVHFYSV
jgi:hypothetical protein